MIICPKKELFVPIPVSFGIKGFFKLQTINKFSGLVTSDTGWMPNLLLTSGRNELAKQATWLAWCHVGTDGTPPVAGNTQLGQFIDSTNNIVSNVPGTQGSAPYYGWRRKTFRFAAQGLVGGENISEVGVGWGSTGSTLVTRAQVINPDTQEPTSVSPLPDEILDVTYEMRYYPPLTDVVESAAITLNGVDYDVRTRAALVTSDIWSQHIGSKIQQYSPTSSYWRAYDGDLGSLEQTPSGNVVNCDNADQYTNGYSENSYQVVVGSNTGPTGWNLASGIRSIKIETTAGAYQSRFDSNPGGLTIPKDITYIMTMEWIIAWSQYT
jgi:hypothetical protein